MKAFRISAILVAILACLCLCDAYLVGPPLKLDQLVQESDVIVKAKVILSEPVKDEWFTEYRGFDVYATEMRVVSVIKGDMAIRKMTFRHYGFSKDPGGFRMMPQHYEFQPGRTYIVFAKKTDTDGVLRQLWKNHKAKKDQGVFLAADNRPVAEDKSVKELIWAELCALLKSADPDDVVCAIRHLNEMSSGSHFKLDDFERGPALEAIHPFVSSKDKQVATVAIVAIGADSPYLKDNYAPHWFMAIGSVRIHGFSRWDRGLKNPGARKYWRELAAVGDGEAAEEIRALAIRALGRAGEPRVMDCVVRWVEDPDRLVRQAAVILLTDFPGKEASRLLTDRSKDEAAEVRSGVARAVGFGQFEDLLPLLDQLLEDEDARVRAAAALSLLSFPAAKADAILKAHVDDADFKSVFVNALAETDPEPYLDALAEIIENCLEPKHFWGGRIPHALSWTILFEYLQGKSDEDLSSGSLDKYMDVLERGKVTSSSEPQALYGFYVKHTMMDRARRFREKCKATFTYDIDYYFKAVDKNYGLDPGE